MDVSTLHRPHADFVQAVERVRGEFLEMPGLHLTRAQAARLWAIEPALCDTVLDALVKAGFLVRSGREAFVRAA